MTLEIQILSSIKSLRLFWLTFDIQPFNVDNMYVPIVNTSRSFPHSWLIIRFLTSFTRRVPLMEQELLTLPEHLSSPPVFSWVRVERSLVLCVCFVDRCLYFFFWTLCCLFFFDMRILITPLVSSISLLRIHTSVVAPEMNFITAYT